MKKLLFAAAMAAAVGLAAPASAQIWAGADPGGVGVRVGPFGVGVGPDYGWGSHGPYYGYADCRVIRERIVRPNGRVMWRSRRVCY